MFFSFGSCYHQRRFLLTSLTGISFAELQISLMRSVSLAAFCCLTLLEMSSRTLVESSLEIGSATKTKVFPRPVSSAVSAATYNGICLIIDSVQVLAGQQDSCEVS